MLDTYINYNFRFGKMNTWQTQQEQVSALADKSRLIRSGSAYPMLGISSSTTMSDRR